MIFFNLRRNPVQLLFLTSSKGQGSTKRTLVAAGECRSRSICPESIQALSSPLFSFPPVKGKTPESSRAEGDEYADNSVQVGVVDEDHIFKGYIFHMIHLITTPFHN
jgi:hypothetical protein